MKLVTAAAKARSGVSVTHGDIDEVWCLFDVEWPRNHPDLDKAVEHARRNDVSLAISNPCFELWLALHFDSHTAWIDTKDAEKLRQRHDRSSDKGLDSAKYLPLRSDAARRARALSDMHEQNETDFPRDNPSSGMFRFLEAVERNDQASAPRPTRARVRP